MIVLMEAKVNGGREVIRQAAGIYCHTVFGLEQKHSNIHKHLDVEICGYLELKLVYTSG